MFHKCINVDIEMSISFFIVYHSLKIDATGNAVNNFILAKLSGKGESLIVFISFFSHQSYGKMYTDILKQTDNSDIWQFREINMKF